MKHKDLNLKYLTMIHLFIIIPLFLTGCDSEQTRKERCTELRNESSKALRGEGERKGDAILKDWNDLKCESSDIIQG